MRVVLRCCLLVTLVLNGLAGARAAAALAGSAVLPPPAATTAPASTADSRALAQEHHAPAAMSRTSATGHCDDVTPAVSPAGDLHGRDCCQDACQCACPSPAHAPSGLAPPLAAGPGPGRVERSDWSSLRPAPLLRPPIA